MRAFADGRQRLSASSRALRRNTPHAMNAIQHGTFHSIELGVGVYNRSVNRPARKDPSMHYTRWLIVARSLALATPIAVVSCASAIRQQPVSDVGGGATSTSSASLVESPVPHSASTSPGPAVASSADVAAESSAPACPASVPTDATACVGPDDRYCIYAPFTGRLNSSPQHGSTECRCGVSTAPAAARNWSCHVIHHAGPAAPPELA